MLPLMTEQEECVHLMGWGDCEKALGDTETRSLVLDLQGKHSSEISVRVEEACGFVIV